ncbi:Dynein assembly factor 4, axonemal [Eumeta japonica]|uniref:Dynein assembly factor 4, axonemal n=1 Tax=Eumeta variegata TaxID=151549 RepID=A0A4C1T3I5_EUMVA|nr:Dynein assembly factor 4, axonemal [Eumeta japonica]
MSIFVKDYTWNQTEKWIHIRVPLRAVSHDKVDLFTSDSYVKAHFSPFLFEVFLLHDVNIDESKCLIKDDLIVLDLAKRDEFEWEKLEKDLAKSEKLRHKEAVLEKCQERAKQEFEDKRIKKSQLERFAVQKAIEIDTKQHNLIDSRRDAERQKAMHGLEDWRLKTTVLKEESTPKIIEIPDHLDRSEIEKPKEKVALQKSKSQIKTLVKSEYVQKKKEEQKKRVLPKQRTFGQLEIVHTPRSFPTPSRESQVAEEETWLKNITQARRAIGFVSEELRPEEQDPQWCKDKGDEFFRAGNFLGAISAYTHGISLSDKLPALYANRSATHFALGNFHKCLNEPGIDRSSTSDDDRIAEDVVDRLYLTSSPVSRLSVVVTDCSSALDLMKPVCEGNRHSRAACIARRAAGLARLGYLNKAIDEMKAASKLLPDDEKIKKDIYDMEKAWEQNPDSD